MAVLELRRVTKQRPGDDRRSLDRVSFSVEKAEWSLFLSEDLRTRTHLVRLFAGLVRPDDGTVWIGTRDAWRTERTTGRSVGFVLPWQMFPADLTLVGLMETYRSMRHLDHRVTVPGTELRRRLEAVGLSPDQTTASLSADEHLLFQCVLAELHQPTIYIAQDISRMQSPRIRQQVLDFLRARHADGHTLLTVDHRAPADTGAPDRLQAVLGGRLVLNVHGASVHRAPILKGLDLTEADIQALAADCLTYQRAVDETALQDHPVGAEPAAIKPPPETPAPDRQAKLKWPGGPQDR